MKIVFIQPKVGFQGHTWEALGIGYLVAYLKKYSNMDLKFDFFSGFYSTDAEIIACCKDADIIGIGCTSPQYKHGLELANRIKTKDNFIVFGGIHPTIAQLNEPVIDAIIHGEGEQSFLRIVEDYPLIRPHYNEDLIKDVNSIPFPDRHVIKCEQNIQQAFKDEGRRVTSILSSRGCPFNCSFCCSKSLWGNKVRMRSAHNIILEMSYLYRACNIDFIKFADDTFTLNKQRTLEFCGIKLETGLKVPYGCNAHINTVDKYVISGLANSGCTELWFGIESGSPKILKAMNKQLDVKKVKPAFDMCRDYGIKTRAYFLLGMPEETLDDIAMTEKLCDEIKPDIVGFTLLAPFPGNKYFDYDSMKDWGWSKFDEYSNDWVHTETLNNQQLKEIQRRLVDKYQDKATFRQKVQ